MKRNMIIHFVFVISAQLLLVSSFPTSLNQQHENPVPQETQSSPTIPANHGYMYHPQSTSISEQYPSIGSDSLRSIGEQTPQVLLNDPDYQMLSQSLKNSFNSYGSTGISQLNEQLNPQLLPPCSSDGRSVTIDHLRISPESLVQIAKLAQAFGSNPDWKKLRLTDMKTALDGQMAPTHKFSARSIGL